MDSKTRTALVVVAISIATWLLVAVFTAWRDRRHPDVQRIVFRNLDHAWEDGQFEPGNWCALLTVDELAYDMTVYAEGCEQLDLAILTAHIRTWLYMKGLNQ